MAPPGRHRPAHQRAGSSRVPPREGAGDPDLRRIVPIHLTGQLTREVLSAHSILMTTITSAHATTAASAASLFDRWSDIATWPGWIADVEWARLDGPFAEDTTGVREPRRGPLTKFVIEQLDTERAYVDVSILPGARLAFSHVVTASAGGGCTIDPEITLRGPLRALWERVLGKGLRSTAQRELDCLVALVESR